MGEEDRYEQRCAKRDQIAVLLTHQERILPSSGYRQCMFKGVAQGGDLCILQKENWPHRAVI